MPFSESTPPRPGLGRPFCTFSPRLTLRKTGPLLMPAWRGIGQAPAPGRCCRAALIRQPAHSAQAEVDRARSELPRFKVVAISQDHDSIECQTGFIAIPVHKLVDCVAVPRCASGLVRLLRTAAFACSRSGRRKTVLAFFRSARERGFCFMACGLHATMP